MAPNREPMIAVSFLPILEASMVASGATTNREATEEHMATADWAAVFLK